MKTIICPVEIVTERYFADFQDVKRKKKGKKKENKKQKKKSEKVTCYQYL